MTDTKDMERLEREPPLALLATCAAQARQDDELVLFGTPTAYA